MKSLLTLLAILGIGVSSALAQQLPRRGAPQQRQLPVDSIEQLRGGQSVPVIRADEMLDLDLSSIDFTQDILLNFEGQPVTRDVFERSLCLLMGSNEIDQFISFVIIKKIKEEMKAAGQSMERFEVSDDDVLKNFEEQKSLVPTSSGMTVEQWEKQVKEEFGWDRYVEFQKIQLQFDKIFLPDPPEGFLPAQDAKFKQMYAEWDAANKKAAADAEAAGEAAPQPTPPPVPEADLSFIPQRTFDLLDEQFGKMVRDQYARGQDLHPILRAAAKGAIKNNLLSQTNVVFNDDVDGSSKGGVLFTVEGTPIKTTEVYTLIANRVDDAIRQLALREVLCLLAVDKRLQREGAALSDEQFQQALDELNEEYAQSIIPLAKAVQLRGFYNLYHYKRYYRRKVAYQKALEARLTEDNLKDHFGKAGKLFYEHGSVEGTILFLAGDREESAKKMAAAQEQLAGGKSLAEIAMDIGEFPENARSSEPQVIRGRIPAKNRNRLRLAIGETEYNTFVTGYSVADEMFYGATEGTRIGPVFRNYSPRLTGQVMVETGRYYTTGSSRTFEEARASVLEDIADLTFPRWTLESLEQCNIELLQQG